MICTMLMVPERCTSRRTSLPCATSIPFAQTSATETLYLASLIARSCIICSGFTSGSLPVWVSDDSPSRSFRRQRARGLSDAVGQEGYLRNGRHRHQTAIAKRKHTVLSPSCAEQAAGGAGTVYDLAEDSIHVLRVLEGWE